MATTSVRAGDRRTLEREGRLLTKVGSVPVLVVQDEGERFAIEDRCPHLGFPLHRGTVESGLVTCHWHHARFDLCNGCTLDPWADDAAAFDVRVDGDDVWVSARPEPDPVGRLERRLRSGLERGLTLVIAKAVLGLLEADGSPDRIVRVALDHGVRQRAEGWGAGLTVLVAMAEVLDHLDPADRPAALVQALVFVARDTRGHAPRVAEPSLGPGHPPERLTRWYRRFVETRTADAAERALATLVASGDLGAVERAMTAAATDHVLLDGGHTLDFTNKAFEAVARSGPEAASLLTSLVAQTCAADRAEESGEWRHPVDLAALAERTIAALPAPAPPTTGELVARNHTAVWETTTSSALGWALLDEDPERAMAALVDAARAGATPEMLGRGLAFAAALRIVRFHLDNDPGDWDTVHHAFTYANALHRALVRRPTPELARGLVHGALLVHLDRFLNIPAARRPTGTAGTVLDLAAANDVQGGIDRAAEAVWGHLQAGGSRAAVIAALGHVLVREDAGFHWFQVYEAGVRQALAWPEGSEESALVLVAIARFLAAHTPTRRELAGVVRTAARLRRGDALFEGAGASDGL